MTPLLLVAAGIVALGVGIGVLRSFGPRYRVGRLLSATPIVTIAEARTIAREGSRYVGIRGRIDAEDEFEDDAHRPLVYRRARLELADRSSWRMVDEHVRAIDFDIREGLDAIAVDRDALGHGLVVVLRESIGTAADAPDRVPDGTNPATPMRLRVEQISSVEHAIVLGLPTLGADGTVRLTAGMGRPLVLTTLEPAEAMRVLAGSGSRRPLAAALALGAGLLLITAGVAWGLIGSITATALAASPSLPPEGGDPRSSGQGPGLVGDPAYAVGVVLAIAALAIVATLVYVRITGGRRT